MIIKNRDEMGVPLRRLRGLTKPEATRHPQMGHHCVPIVEADHQKFAMAPDGLNFPTLQPADDFGLGGVVPGSSRVKNGRLDDGTTNQGRLQVTTCCFDFRKLGQSLLRERGRYGNPLMQIDPRPFGQILGDAMNGLARKWKTLTSPALFAFIPVGIITLLLFRTEGASAFLSIVFESPERLESLSAEELIKLATPFLQVMAVAVVAQMIASIFVYIASHRNIAADLAGLEITGAEARRFAVRRLPIGLLAGFLAFLMIVVLIGVGLTDLGYSVWSGRHPQCSERARCVRAVLRPSRAGCLAIGRGVDADFDRGHRTTRLARLDSSQHATG